MNDKNYLKPWAIISRPKPGSCQVCGTEHEEIMPHNAGSLYYQYSFFDENGRWPTWEDAMSHCDDEMKEIWRQELKKHAVLSDSIPKNSEVF